MHVARRAHRDPCRRRHESEGQVPAEHCRLGPGRRPGRRALPLVVHAGPEAIPGALVERPVHHDGARHAGRDGHRRLLDHRARGAAAEPDAAEEASAPGCRGCVRSRSRRSRRPCTRRARRHPPARGPRPRAQRGSPRRRAASRCGPSPWRTRSRRCRRWRCGSRARSAPWSQSRTGRNIGQRQLRIDLDELEFDRKADAHLRGVDPDEVGHQARTLGELDERDDVARIEAGQPGLVRPAIAVDGSAATGLHRVGRERATGGTHRAWRMPQPAAPVQRWIRSSPRRTPSQKKRLSRWTPGRGRITREVNRSSPSSARDPATARGSWRRADATRARPRASSTLMRISSPARMPPAASRDPRRAVKARRCRARPLRLLFAPGCLVVARVER